MTTKNIKKSFLSILLVVLIAAMALLSVGCGTENTEPAKGTESPAVTTASADVTVLGEGRKVFDLTVTDFDGKETAFEIHTDKETVGEALLDLGLIAGDDGPYGLYVKTVNGITADYDKDGKYWAFYIDNEYAMTGVDVTKIENEKSYAFKVE